MMHGLPPSGPKGNSAKSCAYASIVSIEFEMKRAKPQTPSQLATASSLELKKPVVIRTWRLFFWVYVFVGAPFGMVMSLYLLFEVVYGEWEGWILLLSLVLGTVTPLSVYGLIPVLRAQRRVLLEIRNEGLWSPQTGAVPWQAVKFVGFRRYGSATVTSTWLEVFVSSESEPDCSFDLDDTNIYWTRRLTQQLQRLTTVKKFRAAMGSYQPVGSSTSD
jgi:hypothetical protein